MAYPSSLIEDWATHFKLFFQYDISSDFVAWSKTQNGFIQKYFYKYLLEVRRFNIKPILILPRINRFFSLATQTIETESAHKLDITVNIKSSVYCCGFNCDILNFWLEGIFFGLIEI